jgi:hypothetical protein
MSSMMLVSLSVSRSIWSRSYSNYKTDPDSFSSDRHCFFSFSFRPDTCCNIMGWPDPCNRCARLDGICTFSSNGSCSDLHHWTFLDRRVADFSYSLVFTALDVGIPDNPSMVKCRSSAASKHTLDRRRWGSGRFWHISHT